MDLDFQRSCWIMEAKPEYLELMGPSLNKQQAQAVLNNFSEVQTPTNWPDLLTNCFEWESRIFNETGISSLSKLSPFADALYLEEHSPSGLTAFQTLKINNYAQQIS